MPNDQIIDCADCGITNPKGSIPDDRLQYDDFQCRDCLHDEPAPWE
jgi:hypothetical protein